MNDSDVPSTLKIHLSLCFHLNIFLCFFCYLDMITLSEAEKNVCSYDIFIQFDFCFYFLLQDVPRQGMAQIVSSYVPVKMVAFAILWMEAVPVVLDGQEIIVKKVSWLPPSFIQLKSRGYCHWLIKYRIGPQETISQEVHLSHL